MRSILVVPCALAALTACGRDVQTEREVTTKTSDGNVAISMSGDAADKRGVAMVRVVNAANSAPSVTVRADEMRTLPSVDFKGVTPYQSIDKTWATFQISGGPGGTYAPLETNREMLADGHRYTLLVMNNDEGTGFTTRVLRDEISDDMNRAHLRVIHAAPGTEEIDVVARGGDTLFEGINARNEAGFKDIAPWTGTLEIRAEDGNRVLATLPKVSMKAGTSYTVVVTRAKPAGKLQVFVFEDTPGGANTTAAR